MCAERKNEAARQHETRKTEEVAGAGQREPCIQILLTKRQGGTTSPESDWASLQCLSIADAGEAVDVLLGVLAWTDSNYVI